MLAVVRSATLMGVSGEEVSVEVHSGSGLPGFTVVGLPDATCREARDRVRAALLSSGFKWPGERVTVNLAPSGIRKIGAGLDAAIAFGVLVASGQAVQPEGALAIIGELDHYTPPDDVVALEASGVTVVRYPGAEHGFAHAPERPAHRPADAADAFERAHVWLIG